MKLNMKLNMKLRKLFAAGTVAALALLAAPNAVGQSRQDNEKVRMGVLALEFPTHLIGDAGHGAIMADMLLSELKKNRNYELELIERTRLNQVLLGFTGPFNQLRAVLMIGKAADLDYIVVGTITSFSAAPSKKAVPPILSIYPTGTKPLAKSDVWILKVGINIKVLDVKTAEIILARDEDVGSMEIVPRDYRQANPLWQKSIDRYSWPIKNAIVYAAHQIMRHIAPMEGKVVKVSPKEIIIDMGLNHGVEPKDRFNIVREGEPIRDSQGDVTGVDITEIAHIEITRVESTMSYGKVKKIFKPHQISQGDIARRQRPKKGVLSK